MEFPKVRFDAVTLKVAEESSLDYRTKRTNSPCWPPFVLSQSSSRVHPSVKNCLFRTSLYPWCSRRKTFAESPCEFASCTSARSELQSQAVGDSCQNLHCASYTCWEGLTLAQARQNFRPSPREPITSDKEFDRSSATESMRSL